MPDEDEIEKISAAIAGLEAQRAVLGDNVVDSAVAALRQQLAQQEDAHGESGEERKLVTIVFSDISGFTTLAEKEDAETVRELINACFDCLVPPVHKYGGTIDKFIGDEIMALFGAPLAHEDDAERALRAALEMMEALADFNRSRGTSLGLHFGINTGSVVAGEIGGRDRREYSVMGDAVNLAARLEDASSAGEIFVGPITYRLTSRLFEFEALPPLKLKGKEAPVEVHRLIGLRETPKSTRGIEGLRTSLVGRESELTTLRKATEALARGEGNVLVILGEAGLGKSRLLAETHAALPPKVRWVEGRALSYTSGMGYWLAREVTLRLFDLPSDTAPPEMARQLRRKLEAIDESQLFPYFARMLDLPMTATEEERVKFLSGEALQGRILDAVRDHVRGAATRQPLVLVWEDLHWCDPSSRQVFERLLPLTQEVPLLILSAARPEEDAGEQPDATQIRLSPLTREESGALIQQLLRIENLPERTREVILGRAEGNPFFLEELLRGLIDAGVVVMQNGRAIATAAIEAIEIPETVQGVLAARIDRLQVSQKHVLQRASVIGRIFQQRVLAHFYGDHQRSLLKPALGELREREFISSHAQEGAETAALDPNEFIFRHAITHEVTYGSMLLARRKELHQLAAEAIEQLFPDRIAELAATLGFHFDRAENSARAAFYLARAADAARANFSNTEAILHYQNAIRHAERLLAASESQAARADLIPLHEALGDVLTLTARHADGRTAFEKALAQTDANDATSRSRLYRKIGLCHSAQRNYAETGSAFDQADAALEGGNAARDSSWWEEKLQTQLERMHLYYWQDMVPEMRAVADAFEAAIEEKGTPAQQSRFLKMLALSLLMGSHFHPPAECIELARRAVEASEGMADLAERGHARFVLGLTSLWHGLFAEAVEDFFAALELAERAGDLVLQARCLNYQALLYRHLGDVPNTRAKAAATLALTARLQMIEYVAMATANLAWVAWKEDRLSLATELGEKALALWHGMESPLIFDWIALWPLIAVDTQQGNTGSARERMRGLFVEGQQPLPNQVLAACREVIDFPADNATEALQAALERALKAAHESHHL